MSSLALKTEKLTKVHRIGSSDIWALREVDLEVEQGDFVSIIGPSGSGKTTLLNMLGALDKPTSGSVYIEGVDLRSLNGGELCKLRLRKIGFVFQLHHLIPTLTALENVELPMILLKVPRQERRKRSSELLSLVGLAARSNHKPSQLSGGESQRVAIARALANDPSIILADEPTGNVDSETAMALMDLFEKANRELGKTIVVVTHNIEVARRARKVLCLKDGVLESSSIIR